MGLLLWVETLQRKTDFAIIPEMTNAIEKDIIRPLANFLPSIWGNTFASFSFQDSEFEACREEMETLKEKVKDMSMMSTRDVVENIEYINLLSCLGVSYHFEIEIEKQLNHIFNILPHYLENNECDLYTIALLFRILRQYGYKASCEVFNKFKDSNGVFKKEIRNDVKGLLSLYEASFLSMHGEDILDEALIFTKQCLEKLTTQLSPRLAQLVRNALFWPFHQSVGRLRVRQFISFYEEDESSNQTLLKFAKIDFNLLQLLYKQELAMVSRWWKDLNLAEKFPYTRDRIVEAYLWSVGSHFQPEYGVSRMLLAKFIQMATLVDDTYDAYAKFDELRSFTAAIERWNMDAIDELPEYMKTLYKFVLDFFDEIESDGHDTSYAKETFKDLVRSNHVEAEWANSGCVPTLDEYMVNGLVSGGYDALPAISFIGMKTVAGSNEFNWLQTNPKIVTATKSIARLRNDIMGHEKERQRGDCPSSVECYMNEYNVSKEKAIEEIQKICANAWKDINEDYMNPNSSVSKVILKYYLDLVRTLELIYKNDDSYTNALSMKDAIGTLFLEKLSL